MPPTIKTVDYKSKNASSEFTNSLHHTGFAILRNHPLDTNLITSIYEEWGVFFNNDEKHTHAFHPENQDGYFPFRCENAKGYSKKDLKEFYHVYEWGRYPNSISDKTKLLFHKLMIIGKQLLIWIDKHSPDDVKSNYSIPLSEMIENSRMNLLRIIHYPPLEPNNFEGALRAGAHGDINLITILPAGSQPGLQVQTKKGEWLDVQCNPGWLIINTGDMLNECSNKYFPSTIHRVINPKGADAKLPRYTMPFFIHPRDEVILSDRYTSRSFLDERLNEIGLKKDPGK